jgi:arsenate reductase
MARVLFVCLHNAGRSQMSEALFGRAAGGRHEARSAGTEPAERVHPQVVEAMNELGIDLSDRTPHLLERADAEWADVVVTMGCGDSCPYIPGRRYLDWELEDPARQSIEEVRVTRDEIARRIEALLDQLDSA